MGKLVRDKIPDIIRQSGRTPKVVEAVIEEAADSGYFRCGMGTRFGNETQ